jgi:hypothetical protein
MTLTSKAGLLDWIFGLSEELDGWLHTGNGSYTSATSRPINSPFAMSTNQNQGEKWSDLKIDKP